MTANEVARWIEAFDAADDHELQESRNRILQFLESSPDPLSKTNYQPGHITASGIVLSPDLSQFLLVKHTRLGRWLQPGGHVEKYDRDPCQTAAREAVEETDVSLRNTRPALIGLDTHEVPAGRGEPRHLHHDLAFLFLATSTRVRASEDSDQVAWCRRNEMSGLGLDASIRRHVKRAWAVASETDGFTNPLTVSG